MSILVKSQSIAYTLSAPVTIMLVSFYLTFAIFVLVEKFYYGTFRWGRSFWFGAIISSVINGFVLIGISNFLNGPHIVAPAVILTILYTIEMAVFIEDKYWQSYIAVGFCITIHLAVNYDVGAVIMQYWYYKIPDVFIPGLPLYGTLLMVFACLASGTIIFVVRLSKIFPIEEFRAFIHIWRKGALLAFVVVGGSLLLLITHAIMAPSAEAVHDSSFTNILYLNNSLKSVFVLVTCYTIILISAYSERIGAMTKSLAEKLEEESAFRKSSQRNVLYYYQVNINTFEMMDKNDFINPEFISEDKNHNQFLNRMQYMIHEEDVERISDLATFDFIKKDEEESYSLNERIRFSVKGLLTLLRSDQEQNQKARERLLKYDKEYIWIEISTTVTYDAKKDEGILYITISDVDDKVEIESNLIQAAQTDMLTGLLNRQAAEDIIKKRILKKEIGALFMMDLDGFKGVNDTLGHPKGDDVLIETADRLRELFRGEDVICRLGGDEFMIYAVGLENSHIIAERARLINRKVSQEIPVPDTDKTLPISASIGIAKYPNDASSFADLYKNADDALYYSKNNGKNTYTFFDKM